MKAFLRLLAMVLLPFYAWAADSDNEAVADPDAVVSSTQDVLETTAPLIIESDPADDASGQQLWDIHLLDGTKLESSEMHGTRMRMFRIPESAVKMAEEDDQWYSTFDIVIHGSREQNAGDDDSVKSFEINKDSITFTQRVKIIGSHASSETVALPSDGEPLVQKTFLDEESEESAVVLGMRSFDETRNMLMCQTSSWYQNFFTGACRQKSGGSSSSGSSTTSTESSSAKELGGILTALLAAALFMDASGVFDSAPESAATVGTSQFEYAYSYSR